MLSELPQGQAGPGRVHVMVEVDREMEGEKEQEGKEEGIGRLGRQIVFFVYDESEKITR